jgi:hypothetical protein
MSDLDLVPIIVLHVTARRFHTPISPIGLPLDAFNHQISSLAARDRTGINLAQDRLRPERTARAT